MGISLALLAEGLAQGLGGAGHVLQQQQEQAEMRQMQQQEQERQRQMDSERRMLALEQQRERQQGQEQQRMLAMGEQERQRGMAGLFSRGLITAPELAAIPEGAQPGDIERLMTTLDPKRRAKVFGQRLEKPESKWPSAEKMMAARRQVIAEHKSSAQEGALLQPLTQAEIAARAKELLGVKDPSPELIEALEPPLPPPPPPPPDINGSLLEMINSGEFDDATLNSEVDEAIEKGKISPEHGGRLKRAIEIKAKRRSP